MTKNVFKILSCLILIFSVHSYSYAERSLDAPIVWSLSAVSDTLKDLFGHYCIVHKEDLYPLGNFIYKDNPHASLKEIQYACEYAKPHLAPALFYYGTTKNGECPMDGEKKPGFEQKTSGQQVKSENNANNSKAGYPVSCEYFMGKLIENQNKYVDIYGEGMFTEPGLYVKKVENKNIYKIVNFVKSDTPRQDINIYVIGDDNKSVSLLPISMYTDNGEMFVDITTTGDIFGMFNNRYIYTDVDLTDTILKMTRQGGRQLDMLIKSLGLKSNQYLDVKSLFCGPEQDGFSSKVYKTLEELLGRKIPDFRYDGQSKLECHTNGVIFQNKIVTLEWLGHYLFGARKGLNSDGWADGFYDQRAAREQQNTSGKSGGQGSDDGEQLMAVQDIGYNDAHFMKLFSDVQTKNAAEAIKKVKEFLVEQGVAQNIDAIDCPVNLVSKCRKRVGYQDYVICIVDKIHYQFEFDDICDVKLNGNDPVAGRPYSDYGGYIVRPGRM